MNAKQQLIVKNVDAHRQEILDAERWIWQHPQVGYTEWQANEYLIESYALLKAQMASQFRLSGSPERLEESNKEHIRIINAMLGEDLEEAEAALRDHLRKARESGYDIVVTPDMGDDTGSDN